MLAIRLKKRGRKHQPSFRIVVAEKRSKRDGREVEDIGFYNPISKAFNVKEDRVKYWLSVGVQATPTVWNLLVKHKIINAPKIPIKIKKIKKETDLAHSLSADQKEIKEKEQVENQNNIQEPEKNQMSSEIQTTNNLTETVAAAAIENNNAVNNN
jgi:small subunit ribosomal protein S16